MFEKVNPGHPDKLADRIGGAIIDLGYKKQAKPIIAGECLIGHGNCHIILETSVDYNKDEIASIVERIVGKDVVLDFQLVPQDSHLAENQSQNIRCGDNGIFKACSTSREEQFLTDIVRSLYEKNPTDGKYIYDESTDTIIACQSNIESLTLKEILKSYNIKNIIVNPLGNWTGGINVDTGATNRKLGSDMGRAVTGGGLHFKDISKSDVSINVYLHKIVNEKKLDEVSCKCAIGDKDVMINGELLSYEYITNEAKKFIDSIGGFEKFAEWGLIR